ncbi:MAG: hypothetical protein BroJett042_06080 [Bacteroidota bacterium]|nr:MAG: signal peptidase I [Bacteroidetes bacterium OLB12]GIL22095.1 MAG: hypothetical protein BroJett042_06080 [Bacteroidota bacterium]HNU42897.1 DUF5684 domain-containing protein [Cyclobacteriaceae bacterium]
MEDFNYDSGAATGIFGTFFILWLVVLVFYLFCMWKIFEKAGKPGWAAIIPIYNYIVLLEIVGKPVWWVILLLIPFVNIFVGFYIIHLLSKSFGHDIGFTLLLIFLGFIGIPMLAFGSSKYVGPAGANS